MIVFLIFSYLCTLTPVEFRSPDLYDFFFPLCCRNIELEPVTSDAWGFTGASIPADGFCSDKLLCKVSFTAKHVLKCFGDLGSNASTAVKKKCFLIMLGHFGSQGKKIFP